MPVVKFEDIGNDCSATFLTALVVADIGKVVSPHLTVAKTVILGLNNAEGMGVLEAVDIVNGIGTVALRGWHWVPYSGAAPGLGYTALLVDGSGKFKTGAGLARYIAEVNTTDTQILVFFG